MSVPAIPTVTFTRSRQTSDGLSLRNTSDNRSPQADANTQTSPSGSPVLNIAAMCRPTMTETSPPPVQPQSQVNERSYTRFSHSPTNNGYPQNPTPSYNGYQGNNHPSQNGYQGNHSSQNGYGNNHPNYGYQGVQPPAYQVQNHSPVFRDGVFKGLQYADVTDKNVELVKMHDRMNGSLTPYVCGNVCNFDWDYVKWFNNTFKRSSIILCTKCPYSVLIANTKFPANDPSHPSAPFSEVWENDRGYFQRMPTTVHYMNIKWLYERRSRRMDRFPADMQRCKHAGKSFEQVLTEAPQYFQWIIYNYSGQDEVFFDAMDWWSENKDRAPLPDPVVVEGGVPIIPLNTEGAPAGLLGSPTPTAIVNDTTKFQSGKHRNKTMFQVAVYDPDYFDWLEGKCQSRDPLYQGAVEWYKINRERIHSLLHSLPIASGAE